MSTLMQAVVMAAATIVSGATLGMAGMVWSVYKTIEENRERSIENREILTGQAEDRTGVMPRLRKVERQVFREEDSR